MEGNILPVIDLSPLRRRDRAAQLSVAAQVDEAFRTVGFCYVTQHGVPQQTIDDAFAAAAHFFALPAAKKNEIVVDSLYRGYTGPTVPQRAYNDYSADAFDRDDSVQTVGGREMFNFSLEAMRDDPDSRADGWTYGPNRWPDFMPAFRPAIYGYYEAVARVGLDLARAVGLALDVPEDKLLAKFGKNTDQCTVLHYPPLTASDIAAGVVSSPAHCDYSCMTLLYQDDVGGLQVRERSSGEWIDAPPLPGAFVINVGDLLARWSNDRYVSTPHRVMNRSGRERYSIGTFFNPAARSVIDPRELGVTAADARYPPIEVGRYIRMRFEELYS